MPPEGLERAMGRVEQATENLSENITGLRVDMKTLTTAMGNHHDQLKDGKHEFKRQKINNGVMYGWLVALSVIEFPKLLPYIKVLYGKVF